MSKFLETKQSIPFVFVVVVTSFVALRSIARVIRRKLVRRRIRKHDAAVLFGLHCKELASKA